jgi:hypothetical protein
MTPTPDTAGLAQRLRAEAEEWREAAAGWFDWTSEAVDKGWEQSAAIGAEQSAHDANLALDLLAAADALERSCFNCRNARINPGCNRPGYCALFPPQSVACAAVGHTCGRWSKREGGGK